MLTVGGTEPESLAHGRIAEGLFRQPLTIIECAGDPQRRHIVPPAGQLLLLSWAHQARRVQNHHARPRAPVEGCRHCAAGVPGRRHQYGQRARRTRFQPLQTLGQETRAKVFEGGGRTVKQFERKQRVRAGLDRGRRRGQIQRGIRYFPERRPQPIAGEEPVERQPRDVRQPRDPA
jgi:hypothetical protein